MNRKTMIQCLLLPAALFSAAALAQSSGTDAAPAGNTAAAAPHAQGRHAHWMHSPFAEAMHQLNLTDAQKLQIHKLMSDARSSMHDQFHALKAQHDAFERAIPGTAEFQNDEANLAQAAAAAAQAHVQQEADIHAKIYALLTDAQKSQLATLLSQQSQGSTGGT